MTQWLEAFGYYNALYCSMYLAAAVVFYHRPLFAVSVAPLFIVMMMPESMTQGDSVLFAYAAMGFIYLTSSVLAMFVVGFSVAIALGAMAIYCFIFSLDTWVNSNVETWVYLNHEIIVAVLHLFIILSNSKRLCRMVGGAADTCVRCVRGGKGNFLANNRSKSRKGA